MSNAVDSFLPLVVSTKRVEPVGVICDTACFCLGAQNASFGIMPVLLKALSSTPSSNDCVKARAVPTVVVLVPSPVGAAPVDGTNTTTVGTAVVLVPSPVGAAPVAPKQH